jgi:ADP-heptose:LPS heptosyltransferase/GT2 family glycosyltransferase/glycosyltransferase involved in cell wall biosynthesis
MMSERPRVNFVTPLPPLPGPIASHSALILPSLADLTTLKVWTSQHDWSAMDGVQIGQFTLHNVPTAALITAQASFYAIGNNALHHGAIWEASRRAPGIIILHDSWLHDLFAGFATSPSGTAEYIGMMGRFHGPAAAAAAAALVQGDASAQDLMLRYPMTQAAIDGSRGVIVHNEAELARIRQLSSIPVWHIPPAGDPSAYASALIDIAAELSRPRPVAVPAPWEGSSPIEGNVEILSPEWIVGWARARGSRQAVLVRVFVDDRCVAETQADEFREDVRRAGLGDGLCGFLIRVPPAARAETTSTLAIVAVWRDDQVILLQDDAIRIRAPADMAEADRQAPPPTLYIHVTDLLVYAAESPTISGIQRVQIGYISHWIKNADPTIQIKFAIFSVDHQKFYPIDAQTITWLIDDVSQGPGTYEHRRRRLLGILHSASLAPALQPEIGDTMLVTGAFWNLRGLLPAIRRLQMAHGLRYLQLFYDAVPSFAPETCPPAAVLGYNRAIPHLLAQADAVLAISESTAGELRLLATRLGYPSPPITIVPLGTEASYDFRPPDDADLPPGLGDFILCVGTIEPRKNHLYLYHLWRRLLGRTGAATPRLVCVGQFGWMTETLRSHLQATENLDGFFVVLDNVSDAQLRALYRACRFTIYPSLHEGWGLPVSESLSAGRLCVTSHVAALPEAGGDWAVYLDPFDLNDGFAVLTSLIDNPDLVTAKEEAIRATFTPLSWAAAAAQAWQRLGEVMAVSSVVQRRAQDAPFLPLDQYHLPPPASPTTAPMTIARNEAGRIVFGRVLAGLDWHAIEPWGVWAQGRVARLTFQVDTLDDDEAVAYLRLTLPRGCEIPPCSASVNGGAPIAYFLTGGSQSLRVPLGAGGRIQLDLTLGTDVAATGDQRPLGLGFLGLYITLLSRAGAEPVFPDPPSPAPESEPEPAPAPPPIDTAPAWPEAIDTVIKLEIDNPGLTGNRATKPLRGLLTVSGWALATGGIERVEIWLDANKLGNAYIGMRREDVGIAFPDIEGSLLSGYAMTVPHRAIGSGERLIRLVAVAKSGQTLERHFHLTSETPEASALGAIRRTVPEAETSQRLAILSKAGIPPHHAILIYVPGGQAMDPLALQTTLESLRRQTYPHWQAVLWLADPAVPPPPLPSQVHLHHAPTEPAWPHAQPGHPTLVSATAVGDQWGADALLEMALEATLEPDSDFIYADERRHDISSGTHQPWFKPDWSPALLLATNYIGRSWCARAGLIQAAGLSPGMIAAEGNYSAVLRLTEQARGIHHIPRVLYEQAPLSPGPDPEQDRKALQAAGERRGQAFYIRPGRVPGTWRVAGAIGANTTVSVIIPTCAAGGLVENVIRTLRSCTDHVDIEIIVIDNIPADKPDWKRWLRDNADHVLDLPGAFNWSRFNNEAARTARGQFLLFLNDDIEGSDPDWLRAMLEYAAQPTVGVVGPQLLYPNGSVQHAGMFLSGSHGLHAFRFLPGTEPGPFGVALTPREVTAVTGACLLVRREVFETMGGFDEAHSVINNDLDFCLRAGRAGLRVIYTPHATLTHHELASRSGLPDTFDEAQFRTSWRTKFLQGDRFYNANLALDAVDYLPESEPVGPLYSGPLLPAAAEIRRILILKLDHIGDFLTAFPALRRLKQHFPHAEITVMAAAASLKLANLEPAVDHTIEFNFFHAISAEGQRPIEAKELDRLGTRLRLEQFDIAIDFRVHPETRSILQYTGARLLAGFDRDGQMPWLDIAPEWEGDDRLLPKRAHITDRLVLLADAVANACASPAPSLAADTPDRTYLDPVLVARNATEAFRARPIVCIHPAAGNAMKQWPAASFAGLIDLLVECHDVSVVLIGNDLDVETVEAVMASSDHPTSILSLAGHVALDQLAKILPGCVLFIGNDSGPKHLAATLGLPTIGIHSGNIDATEWGPTGPRAVAIRRTVACSPCYIADERECPRALACLRGIRVQDVYRAARPLLALQTTTMPPGPKPIG